MLRLGGRLAWVEGRTKAAMDLFEDSLDVAEALGATAAKARAFAQVGTLLRLDGRSLSLRGQGADGCEAEARRALEMLDVDVPEADFLRA